MSREELSTPRSVAESGQFDGDLSGRRSDNRLLTVQELAEVLSVPRSWVYARTATDEIPHVCVGRYKRFRLGEVMRWLSAEQTSTRAARPRA